MQTPQGNTLQSLRNVQQFMDRYASELSEILKTGAKQKLDAVMTELGNHVSDQTSSVFVSKGATQKQVSLRSILVREHMAPINRVARLELAGTPELTPFLMPKGRPTAEKLAAIAYGMAKAAKPFEGTFIESGLPLDFITQLNQTADEFLQSLANRTQTLGVKKGATAGLEAALIKGRKVVHILDVFVRTKVKDNAALLANWNLIKRVPALKGNAGAATPPAAGTTPTAPATAATPIATAPATPTTPTAATPAPVVATPPAAKADVTTSPAAPATEPTAAAAPAPEGRAAAA